MKTNSAAIAAALKVTQRRVLQLAEMGVLIADDAGHFDPADAVRRYGIYSRRDPDEIARLLGKIEAAGEAAIAAADALGPDSPLDDARRAAGFAEEFDRLGQLYDALRPEAERAASRHLRASICGGIIGLAMAVAMAHQNRNRPPFVEVAL